MLPPKLHPKLLNSQSSSSSKPKKRKKQFLPKKRNINFPRDNHRLSQNTGTARVQSQYPSAADTSNYNHNQEFYSQDFNLYNQYWPLPQYIEDGPSTSNNVTNYYSNGPPLQRDCINHNYTDYNTYHKNNHRRSYSVHNRH